MIFIDEVGEGVVDQAQIFCPPFPKFLDPSLPYAQQHVPNWDEKLQSIEIWSEDDLDIELNHNNFQYEEWMHLANMVPGSFANNNEQTL